MPSVRTESQPISVAHSVAISSANGTATHHGQPRLISALLLVPSTATA
jgi:hypothetical protein